VFFNGLWGYNIVRLMLSSGIGNPYDPVKITGSLGRGPALIGGGASRSVTGTFANIGGNAYPAGSGFGGAWAMRDLADDNFDHTGLDFIGGAFVLFGRYLGSGPGNLFLGFATNPAPSMIGSTFKASLKDTYLPTKTVLRVSPTGMWPPTTDWFMDLDPHYTDIYGDPVARLTLDYGTNYIKCANTLAPKYAELLTKMGATNVTTSDPVTTESHATSWSAHIRGGARIGTDPTISVFNKWQQCWTSENLFAAGEITEPTGDNTTTGGTHPAGAGSYVAAEGIKKYLASPGPLV
jgi:gluconate 2-dehydrogenase alpha chain